MNKRNREFREFFANYSKYSQDQIQKKYRPLSVLDQITLRGTIVELNGKDYLLMMEHFAAATEFCLYDHNEERDVFTKIAKIELDAQAPAGTVDAPTKNIYSQCIIDGLSVKEGYRGHGFEKYLVDVAKQFSSDLCTEKGIDSMLVRGYLPEKVSGVDMDQIPDAEKAYLSIYATTPSELNALALFTPMGFEPDYIGVNQQLGISTCQQAGEKILSLPEDFLTPMLDGSSKFITTTTPTQADSKNLVE